MAKKEWTNTCWLDEILALPESGGAILGTVVELVMDPGTTEPTGAESPMGVLESIEELPVLLESEGATLGTTDPMTPEAGA